MEISERQPPVIIRIEDSVLQDVGALYSKIENLYFSSEDRFVLIFPQHRICQVESVFDVLYLRHGVNLNKVFDFEILDRIDCD